MPATDSLGNVIPEQFAHLGRYSIQRQANHREVVSFNSLHERTSDALNAISTGLISAENR